MTTLFGDLPEQRAPRVLTMGDHYLIQCSACGGTGEGALVWPDIVQPCRDCDGAGHLLGKMGPSAVDVGTDLCGSRRTAP